jgi:hypothetical protein
VWSRLRDYRRDGQPYPLARSVTRYEPDPSYPQRSPWLYTEKTRLVLTDQGRAYYAEMRPYYRELYPEIAAPKNAEQFVLPSTEAELLADRIRQKRASRGYRELVQIINHPLVSPSALLRAEQGKPISDDLKAAILAWLDSDESPDGLKNV